MFPETIPPPFPELELPQTENEGQKGMSDEDVKAFDALVEKIGLRHLLDLPLIALSNGQTRRARIIKALLRKPELLLLDEPLTGLDVQNRPTLLDVLHTLHAAKAPRVILGLRTQDPIPDWITHVAFVNGSKVVTGPKVEVAPQITHVDVKQDQPLVFQHSNPGKLVVDLQNVNVKYGPRTVLKDINWQVRQGERWHLQGSNGSGKTTLLSLLTGDHPQSYTQQHMHLHGRPRSRIPTPHLQSMTGLLSPEVFDAFPRRADMTVWDAVGTGFDGGFTPLGRKNVGRGVLQPVTEEDIAWRVNRCWEVLEALGPAAWDSENVPKGASKRSVAEEFSKRMFVDLSVGEQRMVLLMHYSLSPVKGESSPHFRFLYEDTIPGEAPTRGSFFVMAPANKRLVQRTFGLLELQAITASQPGLSAQASQLARRERYGPSFAYDEFLVQRSRYSAVKSSTIRWLAKKFLPQPGSGPSEEVMQKGYFKTTNHTTSTSTDSTPPVHVKTTIRGKGDPGYDLTAIMVSESALSLLLPPTSQAGSSSKTSSLPDGLPALARKGGVLTPMTAFGEVLITRLVDSGRFTFESHIVDQRASLEARKDDPKKYATPEAFKEDPINLWKFYHRRRSEYLLAKPNLAHYALATLAHVPTLERIAPVSARPIHVTQNVDALALRVLESLPASSEGEDQPPPAESLIEMHGDIFVTRCTSCQHLQRSYAPQLSAALAEIEKEQDSNQEPSLTIQQLPKCGGDSWQGSNRYGRCGGLLRPEVVWFGEVPPRSGEISRKMSGCDMLLVVGTSSIVRPAADYAAQVKKNGGVVAIFNLGRSNGDEEADFLFLGPCEESLPDVLHVQEDIARLWPGAQNLGRC
ncbi:hypothetical protein H0H93_005463 [Arthromyces matolae]|nr:hypothetical protein H0H93_005463 [Arthromyces matolae]